MRPLETGSGSSSLPVMPGRGSLFIYQDLKTITTWIKQELEGRSIEATGIIPRGRPFRLSKLDRRSLTSTKGEICELPVPGPPKNHAFECKSSHFARPVSLRRFDLSVDLGANEMARAYFVRTDFAASIYQKQSRLTLPNSHPYSFVLR